jgi:hypothetical protein
MVAASSWCSFNVGAAEACSFIGRSDSRLKLDEVPSAAMNTSSNDTIQLCDTDSLRWSLPTPP